MGLLNLIPPDNQLSQMLMGLQQPLNDLGVGLTRGKTWQKGLREASNYTEEQAPLRAKLAQEKLQADTEANTRNSTAAWLRTQPGGEQFAAALENGMIDGSTAFKSWLDASKGEKPIEINGQLVDPKTMQVLGDFRTVEGKGGNAEVALQPTWLQDAQGNWVIGQLSKDGSIVQTKLPEGLSAADPGVVAGTRAGAQVDAKTAATARAALRSAEVSNVNTAKAIADVRNNAKGMNEWFSQWGPRGRYIHPGSEMGKFYAAAEPTNNQAFMQAREALKGGGQITDYEGRKAEDAFSRMRAALDTGDQGQYLRALSDFEEAVALGYQKLQETAQGGYSAGSPAVGGGGNVTSTGVPWSLE